MTDKKVAVVTGATRGIGKDIACNLGKNGYFVLGTSTSDIGARKITNLFKEKKIFGVGLKLDVLSKIDCEETLKTINKKYGNVSILINNAGITSDNLFLRIKDDDWNKVLETNLTGTYLMCKNVIKQMLKNRYGRIVNITSVVGFIGNAGQTNYSASKAALTAFSKSLAKEIGSRNITVNCVAPGFIETDMTEKLSDEQKNIMLDQIPVKRLGSVKDVSNAVDFLISDESSYITGATIHVNGGMFMD